MLKTWWRQAPVTVALCGLMILCYLITATQSLSLLDNLPESWLADHSVLYLPVMNEPWGPMRAITAAFMHIGPAHLLLNLLLLFLLGREVEGSYGSRLYLLVWVVAAIGASTVSVWMDPLVATAGASGVGYALMVIFAFIVAKRGGDLRGPIVLILANIAYTFMTPTVSLWGHLGGLLAGLLLSLALLPRSRALWVVLVGAFFIAGLLWRISSFHSGWLF
ncbi:rhomboid family intramembrane serine protease [Corynebacterium sp. H130]|uniref:rhomboid family intramembrane serine protease n=1 Tax=Corynebacterium sp. H130 TaxID=3133444 RepID=UPI0030AA98C7